MVQPYNIRTAADAVPAFKNAKNLGWKTWACSPFVRGWALDTMVTAALAMKDAAEDAVRARLADHMLRFSLFAPDVDELVVSIRRLDWVAVNAQSASRGPLSPEERQWLLDIQEKSVSS